MKKLAIGLYALVTGSLMIWGFYQAMYVAPSDAMQGEISRIIYYHVPSFAAAFTFFSRFSTSSATIGYYTIYTLLGRSPVLHRTPG